MDDNFKNEMTSYYEARAQEYDEVYAGKSHLTPDPIDYKEEVEKISKIVSTFGKGHFIDIGCGTGFWVPYYATNCSRITLIDQSEKMLLESKRKVEKLGLKDKCRFIQGDFFEIDFGQTSFDNALVGFLVSHLTSDIAQSFFVKLKKILKPDSQLMLIDGAWSSKRQQYRKKEGMQERELNDGRIFNLFKRYFDKSDIESIFKNHRFELKSYYSGDWILAAIGENRE